MFAYFSGSCDSNGGCKTLLKYVRVLLSISFDLFQNVKSMSVYFLRVEEERREGCSQSVIALPFPAFYRPVLRSQCSVYTGSFAFAVLQFCE